MDLVRVTATAAGLNYLPEYVAHEFGYFRDEDLDVRTEAPGHGHWVVSSLLSGEADIALGGIWRPLMYRTGQTDLVPFAQLSHRCPAALISRMPEFELTDLVGRTVAVDGTAPTPLMAFVRLLREAGLDPSAVRILQHFDNVEANRFFAEGVADYLLLGTPASDAMVASGRFAVLDLAEAFGPVPWSVYYSLKPFQEDRANRAGRFARAIFRALTWVREQHDEQLQPIFEKRFASYPQDVLRNAVERLRDHGMWSDSVAVDIAAAEKWRVAIEEFGLVPPGMSMRDLVDPTAADWAENGAAGA